MSNAYVEIDFFRREKRNNAPLSKPSSPESASSSFRGIQGVVSRINPQLLKTVMGSAEHARSSDSISAWPTSSYPPSPCRTASPPPLPVYNPASRCSSVSPSAGTSPLTVFYNGTVTTFDLHHDMAETIMRMAETLIVGKPDDSMPEGNQVVGDLAIARRKSLQRFLEKAQREARVVIPIRQQGHHPLATLIRQTCALERGDVD